MLRTMMETAYSTAMRPCELLRLDVTDIDVESDRGLIRVLGKGEKERMLPIGRHAHRMLCNYIHGVRPLLLRRPEEKALWLTARGTRLKYGRMLALLHQHVEGDQEKVTWYGFRRACATELARSGASLWAIKVLLAHWLERVPSKQE
jgi:integrase/recombinase XerD